MHPISEALRKTLEGAESVSELNEYMRRTGWCDDGKPSKRIGRFLKPHADDYFSILRPFFLHELKSPHVLSSLVPMLARDGGLSLVWYFLRFPAPPANSLLLVNEKLAWAVPASWRQNVAFYRMESSEEKTAANDIVRDIYIVFSAIDERQASFDYIGRKLRSLRESHGLDTTFHILVLSNPVLASVDQTRESSTRYSCEFSVLARDVLGARTRFADWSEIKDRNLRGSGFLDLNESCFYYSDSALVQRFLRGGSSPLEQETYPREPDAIVLPLSFCHSVSIHRNTSGFDRELDRQLESIWRNFSADPILCEEINSFQISNAFTRGNKYCPRSVEDFAWSLGVLANA